MTTLNEARMSHAISPLDGRYHESVEALRPWFSEFGLMRERCRVELTHILTPEMDSIFGRFPDAKRMLAQRLMSDFSESDYRGIKTEEMSLRHDVKACEMYLRSALDLENGNRIHFGLTSEDVNNLAYTLCVDGYRKAVQVPLLHQLLASLGAHAQTWRSAPFPARTHGQHATPTTFGKELAVYVVRLLRSFVALRTHRFRGKFNGATGNYSAAMAAAPTIDWRGYERQLVESLGFDVNSATTQIEDHASLASYFDEVRALNNVCQDLCQDIWMYISYGYISQRTRAGEVGSSTMPHKVNPIRFENAEGNFQLSNALLSFLSDKLSRSRMQRDLSESTVLRNIGVAMGHHHLAVTELLSGLAMIDLDCVRCEAELLSHPELLSEALQSVLRTERSDDVYTELKRATRGKTFAQQDLAEFVQSLPEALAGRLAQLSPVNYLGDAVRICDETCALLATELRG
jgi:adenylosuccinate lyase